MTSRSLHNHEALITMVDSGAEMVERFVLVEEADLEGRMVRGEWLL